MDYYKTFFTQLRYSEDEGVDTGKFAFEGFSHINELRMNGFKLHYGEPVAYQLALALLYVSRIMSRMTSKEIQRYTSLYVPGGTSPEKVLNIIRDTKYFYGRTDYGVLSPRPFESAQEIYQLIKDNNIEYIVSSKDEYLKIEGFSPSEIHTIKGSKSVFTLFFEDYSMIGQNGELYKCAVDGNGALVSR